MLGQLLDVFRQMDIRLSDVIATYEAWTYLIVCGLILLESFPLLAPLLPGGALVITAGALAAKGCLDVWLLLLFISLGATAGDTVTYFLGRGVVTVYLRRDRRAQREHPNLARARAFYDRYGSLTLVLGRFLPLVRHLAPTLAGMGVMTYRRFLLFNAMGCVLWTAVFLFLGYFFGHIPLVRSYLPLAIVVITVLSAAPVAVHHLRQRRARSRPPSTPAG
jgi:membrane-associated protein